MTPGGPEWGSTRRGGVGRVERRRSAGEATGLVGRLMVRLVFVAILGVGLGYAGEWGRTTLQAQDGWSEERMPSNSFQISVPRPAKTGEFGPSETLRSADDDWEILLVETKRSEGSSALVDLFGPEVSSDRLGGIASKTLEALGGKVADVRSFRHDLGKQAVEFSGTYRQGTQERYLKQLVIVLKSGSVLTLKVEANGSRSELVEFLFDEVEGSLGRV